MRWLADRFAAVRRGGDRDQPIATPARYLSIPTPPHRKLGFHGKNAPHRTRNPSPSKKACQNMRIAFPGGREVWLLPDLQDSLEQRLVSG